jgi:hypothetical protein
MSVLECICTDPVAVPATQALRLAASRQPSDLPTRDRQPHSRRHRACIGLMSEASRLFDLIGLCILVKAPMTSPAHRPESGSCPFRRGIARSDCRQPMARAVDVSTDGASGVFIIPRGLT